MDYVIFMDVSGDISEEAAKKYNLNFIPMQYSLNGEMRMSYGIESKEILKKFYDGQRNGDLTMTSQITPFMYKEYFKDTLEAGKSILYIALSSGLSSTYQSCLLAIDELKEEYPNCDIYCVDSLSATGGMGVIVERAFCNREKGLSLEDNYKDLCAMTKGVHCLFMVEDLSYLKRGGRVSATTAFVGSMLNIKPILCVDKNGKLITINKKRGMKAGAHYLVELLKENYTGNDCIYVCNADNQEIADLVCNLIKEELKDVTVKQTILSPIIGAPLPFESIIVFEPIVTP